MFHIIYPQASSQAVNIGKMEVNDSRGTEWDEDKKKKNYTKILLEKYIKFVLPLQQNKTGVSIWASTIFFKKFKYAYNLGFLRLHFWKYIKWQKKFIPDRH